MNRRRLNPRLRIQFVGLLMLLGMVALGLRLWWIQVAHGAEWTAQIRGGAQAMVGIPSVRGEFKDPAAVRTSRHHQRDAERCEGARHHPDC